MSQQQNWLRLQIGGQERPVDADAFLELFQAAVDSLKAIDRTLSTHGVATLQWQIVEAGTNSPLYATLQGEPLLQSGDDYSEQVVTLLTDGLEHLNTLRTCPPRFEKDVMRHVKTFGESAVRHNLRPMVSTATKKVSIADDLASNANWASKTLDLKKRYLVEHGSLEGILKGLTAATRGGDRLVIVDGLTGEETTCRLGSAVSEDLVRRAWKKRVMVTGRIHIDRHTNKPHKIDVEDLVELRDRSGLPQAADLKGIDITEGQHSATYVRDLYNDE